MSEFNKRILFAAIALRARYFNPEVAAFNRARAARSERAMQFWGRVGRFLYKPAPGMAWTDDDILRWRAIGYGWVYGQRAAA